MGQHMSSATLLKKPNLVQHLALRGFLAKFACAINYSVNIHT